MLDPEYLERAGTLVGSVYSQIEAEMCDQLVRDMLAGDISDWHDQRILALLAQGEAPKLRAILEQHRGDVDEAVRREVEEALERSDAHDLRVLKEALGVDLPGIMPMQVMGAVRTVTQMLERDNLAMAQAARNLFYNQSAWAVTQAATGVMGYDEAIRRATRELARGGIKGIEYKDPQTGQRTVTNAIDVAVARHVRSQLSQQCAARTMQVCREVGCEFVEVSSHFGARPSHQDWEGRRYHVGGRVTVDGVTYEDFGEATGYYGTGGHGALGDRLCGVNCRHQFGPWMPGMPHAYEPNPQHPSGKSNEEIYRLTQRQRRLERAIRASKREVAAAERAYEADPTLKNQTTANQLREQLRKRQDALAKLVDENKDVLTRDLRREYAGDMPKVRMPSIAEEHKVVLGKGTGTRFDVDRRAVNGRSYVEKFEHLSVPKRASRTLYYETSEILRDCDGTAHERLAAVSWRTGQLVTDTMGHVPHDFACTFTPEQEERASNVPGGCILLHNHPGSSRPSWADIRSASRTWVRSSVVACHDGTVYELVCNDQSVIDAYAAIVEDVRRSMPEVMDSGTIAEIATERLYMENGRRKWFRLTKR